MLSFRDWAVRNGKVPVANTTNAAIVASVVEYLKAVVEEAFFWSRTPTNNLQNAVQAGLAATLNARPAALPAGAAAPALANYRVQATNWGAQLLAAITPAVVPA